MDTPMRQNMRLHLADSSHPRALTRLPLPTLTLMCVFPPDILMAMLTSYIGFSPRGSGEVEVWVRWEGPGFRIGQVLCERDRMSAAYRSVLLPLLL